MFPFRDILIAIRYFVSCVGGFLVFSFVLCCFGVHELPFFKEYDQLTGPFGVLYFVLLIFVLDIVPCRKFIFVPDLNIIET